MAYFLSKGINCTPHGGGTLCVLHCGQATVLKDPLDELWLSGRFDAIQVEAGHEKAKLEHLVELGLAESSDEARALALYRILTNCVICPAKPKIIRSLLNRNERRIYHWICKAGLRLTTAELVFLFDRDIKPRPQLLGSENRQTLIEVVYTTETIYDGMLESKMEQAAMCDVVINAILGLLHKRRIILM